MKVFLRVLPVLIFAASTTAFAEKLNPFKAEVKESLNLSSIILKHLKPGRGKDLVEKIDPISLNTRIFGVGDVSIKLDRKWLPGGTRTFESALGIRIDPTEPIYFRGTAVLRTLERKGTGKKKKLIPITATLFDSASPKTKLKISFEGNTPTTRFFELSTVVDSGAVNRLMSLSHASAKRLSDKRLDEVTILGRVQEYSNSVKRAGTITAVNKVIQISTESDYQWSQKYGNNSITAVNSILNKAQTIYEEQLNLVFSVVAQNSLQSNSRYTSTLGNDLLKSFADYTNSAGHLGQADVYHLFTGKNTTTLDDNGNLTDALIGLAYTVKISGITYGVICTRPDLAFSFTENTTSSLNHITTAHEIGHNLGATHTSTGGIMATELDSNNPPKSFTSVSLNEIKNHVNNYGACLSAEQATPVPTSVPPASTTPTVSPVPTSRGGGSSGGGFDANTPVHLSSTLSKDGTINFQITLNETKPSCSISLLASDNMNKLNVGTILTTLTSDSISTELEEIIAKKIPKLNKKGKKIKIYFKLRQSCLDGEVYFSEIRNIQPSKVKSKDKEVSAKEWINLLKQGLLQ